MFSLLPRDGAANPPPSGVRTYLPAAIALVSADPAGPDSATVAAGPFHRPLSHHLLEDAGFMPVPGVRIKAIGLPPPSASRWRFVPNPPRERPNAWSPFPGSVLMGPNAGPIHVMDSPPHPSIHQHPVALQPGAVPTVSTCAISRTGWLWYSMDHIAPPCPTLPTSYWLIPLTLTQLVGFANAD